MKGVPVKKTNEIIVDKENQWSNGNEWSNCGRMNWIHTSALTKNRIIDFALSALGGRFEDNKIRLFLNTVAWRAFILLGVVSEKILGVNFE